MVHFIKEINNFNIEIIEKIRVTKIPLEDIGIEVFKDYNFDEEHHDIKVFLNMSYDSVSFLINDDLFLSKLIRYYQNIYNYMMDWKKKNQLLIFIFLILTSFIVTLTIQYLLFTVIGSVIIIITFLIIHKIILPTKNFSHEVESYIQEKINNGMKTL